MRKKDLRKEESAIAPLLLILALAGMGIGGGVVFAIAPQLMLIYFLFVGFFLIGLIALKSGPKTLKMIIPLFVIVVVLVLIFSFIPLPWLTMVPPDFDTDTESKTARHAWYGKGNSQWDDEFLDSMRYITTYKPEGKSEKVVFQGRICLKTGLTIIDLFDEYRIRIDLWDGSNWDNIYELEADDPNPGAWAQGSCINTDSDVVNIETGYSGFLKAELDLHLIRDPRWEIILRDHAYVKEGKVTGNWLADQYEVGETAVFHWETGYCSSVKLDDPESGGCTLQIYSNGQGAVVKTVTLPQNDIGTEEYTITMADFDTEPPCRNELWAYISNDLIVIHEEYTTTIDFSELAPPKPTIKTDTAAYNVGDPIEITIEAEPNKQTQLPIVDYHLRIMYEDPQIILVDEWLSSNTYVYSGAPESGTLLIEVSCQDEGCRPSEIGKKHIEVYPEGDVRGELPLPWILIVLLLVMLFIGIAVIYFVKGIPMIFKAIIFIILLIIPVALYWTGVIY